VHCRIAIRDFSIGGEQLSIVEDRWQAFRMGRGPLIGQWPRAIGDRGIARKDPSGIGKSQVLWTQTLCHRERRNSDGGFGYGHTKTGHMNRVLAGRG
jgi:hypothetical protein